MKKATKNSKMETKAINQQIKNQNSCQTDLSLLLNDLII